MGTTRTDMTPAQEKALRFIRDGGGMWHGHPSVKRSVLDALIRKGLVKGAKRYNRLTKDERTHYTVVPEV